MERSPLNQRLEDSVADVAGVQRLAVPVGEDEGGGALIVQRGQVRSESRDERIRQTDLAPAVLRFRRLDPAFDYRATDADLGIGAVELPTSTNFNLVGK